MCVYKVAHDLCSSLNMWERQASEEEELVPIRIELDVNGHRLRDTFTWNMNGTVTCSHSHFA